MDKALSKKETIGAKIIPIVLCTDHAYSKYALVALQSIIENRSLKGDVHYKVFIFHDEEILAEDIKMFEDIKYDNLDVECKDVSSLISKNQLYTRAHYSKQMFYRWLIPQVLNEYSKAIYLDCDLVVNVDLKQLFDIELGENVIAAVKDSIQKDRVHYYIEKDLKLNKDFYINSGVLLIDIKKFNEENIKDKCLEMLRKHSVFACPDQDALNIVLKDRILILDGCWNVQWSNLENMKTDMDIKILHFTSNVKPWNPSGANLILADWFWKYAKLTSFYENLLQKSKLSKKKQKKAKNIRKNRFLRIITLPFRILKKFFLGWKDVGFKNSLHEICFEIRYIFHRIFGKK